MWICVSNIAVVLKGNANRKFLFTFVEYLQLLPQLLTNFGLIRFWVFVQTIYSTLYFSRLEMPNKPFDMAFCFIYTLLMTK